MAKVLFHWTRRERLCEMKMTTDVALMLTPKDVAGLLQCSDRHITNLRNEGRMPAPIKLGTLVRWPRKAIEDWIAAGCPALADVA